MLVVSRLQAMSRTFLAASPTSIDNTVIKIAPKGPRELAAVAVLDKTVNKAADPRELRRCTRSAMLRRSVPVCL